MSERQYESVKEPFTEAKMAEMREGLIQAVGELVTLEDNKVAANSEMNAAIKAARKIVRDLQRNLSLGYELIEVEVIEVLDVPEPGKKSIRRFDNNYELRIEPMTPRDRQRTLGLE